MERYFHHPVLGTNLFVGIEPGTGSESGLADDLDHVIVAEVARLEAMFTIFDPASELERWKRGELNQPSPEFTQLMSDAHDWVVASGGAFHPGAALLSALWRRAEADDEMPRPAAIDAVVAQLREPGFEIIDGVPVATGDVSGFQLHAFAKGWIVDRAIDAAMARARTVGHPGVGAFDLIVNAGGDLAHRGSTAQRVGIENPLRTADNEPPIDRVWLANGGLATSGRARQGFTIGGRTFSHVIDPRTGWPVDHHASVSVIGPSAAAADVVATIVGVEPTEVALGLATRYRVACAVVTNDGDVAANDDWAQRRTSAAD